MTLPLGEAAYWRHAGYLPIGDFSRATHMSVKTLRHYHRVGLLEPAEVDPYTGYRRYTTGQIPAAQIIRRFRDLDMPIEEIQGVLAAPDIADPQRADRRAPEPAGGRPGPHPARRRLAARPAARPHGPPGRHRPPQRARRPRPPRSPSRHRHRGRRRLVPGRARRAPRHHRRPGRARQRRPPAASTPTELFTQRPRPGHDLRPLHRARPADGPGRRRCVVPPAELAIIEPPRPARRHRPRLRRAGHVRRPSTRSPSTGRSASTTSSASRDTPTTRQWRTEIGWPIFRTASP